LNEYRQQKHKSLMHNAESGEEHICGLKWLDQFFGYNESAAGKPEDKGAKVLTITPTRISKFKARRQSEGATNGATRLDRLC
jgi:hypothetical protein